ncbi:hypothetical protein [Neofamilia massiliensis]|uniref:hypothetical protein n=1 Tax=Neofamilia massiliensis TaxID=1673724 RepID=UPI0006BB626B|nr:hypothetical protein [Neofamilia massiliensis]
MDKKLKKQLKDTKFLKENYLKEEIFVCTLSYKNGKTLKNLKKDEIIKYIEDNYLSDKTIDKNNLINDLIGFKIYRDRLEIKYRDNEVFMSFVSYIVSLIALVVSTITSFKSSIDFNLLTFVIKTMVYIYLLMILFRLLKTVSKNGEVGKLNVINYGIYILEAIKEEMDECSTDYHSEIKRNENNSCKKLCKKLEEKISKKAESIRARRG